MSVRSLRLVLPRSRSRSVALVVGSDLAARLGRDAARQWRARRLALVADSRVASSFAPPILRALSHHDLSVRLFRCSAGEQLKSREGKAALEDRLFAAGYGRDSLFIALGGGTLLDVAGFVAATFTRGVPWVALPTSLLAMVDASIGGKTAVNHPAGKNLIGAYHHPTAVYADIRWLDSLPQREFRSGLAEVVKIAAGLSAPLFHALEKEIPFILRRDRAALGRIIAQAAFLKAGIVRRDETEQGLRQVLNFGHTAGHALELASRFRLSHGEAVAIGMVVEAEIAVRMNGLEVSFVERLRTILDRIGLPVRPPRGMDPRQVIRLTRTDKKTRAGIVRYALPAGFGRMDWSGGGSRSVPRSIVLDSWHAAREHSK